MSFLHPHLPGRHSPALPPFWRTASLGALVFVPAAGATYALLPRLAHPRAGAAPSPPPPAVRAPSSAPDSAGQPAPGESRATPERMEQLTEELRELAKDAPARAAAVYVQDVPSGLTAGVNP